MITNITAQDTIKILLDAGESLHREADPVRIAELVIHTIVQSVDADAGAIIEVIPEKAKISTYRKVGVLSFIPEDMEFNRLACMMKFKPRIVVPMGVASRSGGRLNVSALIYPVQCDKRDYIIWAERIAEHPPFQATHLDIFTILVRQGMLAIENALLTHRLSSYAPNLSTPTGLAQNKGFDDTYLMPASIKNIKERQHSFATNHKPRLVISLGDETNFDPERRIISTRQDSINLTPAESTLIAVLFHNDRQVIAHEDLVSLIQGYDTEKEDAARILRPLVCRLRKKIEGFTRSPDWIQNVRGTGYRIDTQHIK